MNKKILMLVVTLSVIIIAGFLVWIFWPKQATNPIGDGNENNTTVVCPQDAKQCPNGSYVSRTGPNCEFTECPTSSTSNTGDEIGKSFSKVLITRKIYSLNETTKVYEEIDDPNSEFLKPVETKDLLSGPITMGVNNNITFTPEMLKNATYTYESEGGGTIGTEILKVKFENGICNTCGEFTDVGILDGQNYMAFGDLNNDGQQDAVSLISTGFQKSGGNLSYADLAVILNVNGVPTHIYMERLGQSVIDSLKIEGGKIIIEHTIWMVGQEKKIISLKLL